MSVLELGWSRAWCSVKSPAMVSGQSEVGNENYTVLRTHCGPCGPETEGGWTFPLSLFSCSSTPLFRTYLSRLSFAASPSLNTYVWICVKYFLKNIKAFSVYKCSEKKKNDSLGRSMRFSDLSTGAQAWKIRIKRTSRFGRRKKKDEDAEMSSYVVL